MKGYSVIINNIDACCDRYMQSGYSRKNKLPELYEKVSRVQGIKGVELVTGDSFNRGNLAEVKELLCKYKLEAVSVIPDHSGRELWCKGAFTSPNRDTRKAAVDETCNAIDMAREIGCGLVSIWNGQDGYDYPLQLDYDSSFRQLADGVRECADYAPDMKIALEYKPKEPRNHSFISTVHSTLIYLSEIDRKNVGITLDTGHSLMAYENMAEAVATASRYGKLFHMHFNDNYRLWDDDMIACSVHTVEFLELFYWISRCGYEGYISLDQYPYREDGAKALDQSVKWLESINKSVQSLEKNTLDRIFAGHDAIASNELLRSVLFK